MTLHPDQRPAALPAPRREFGFGALALAGLSLAVAFAGAPKAAAQNVEGVAAIVNDEVISTYDVRQRAALLMTGSGLPSSPEVVQRAQAQALRDLVDERLQMQETGEYNIEVSDAEVDRSLGEIARQNGTTAEELARQLAGAGVNPATLRAQLRADIAWQRLVSGRYGSRVRISDSQIDDTLERITANASKAQYLVAEIVFAAEGEDELNQAEAAATRLLQQMREQNAPFAEVARRFSSSSTAAAGGDVGWVAEGELRPELQAALNQMQPNQLSAPIRTPVGVYILALRQKREGLDPAATARIALQQVVAPEASQAQLERVRSRINGCTDLAGATQAVPGAEVIDLGEALEAELSDTVRGQIAGVEPGRAGPVVSGGGAVSTLVVCARTQTQGEGVPSRDEVEGRLVDQELAMLSQRYLRNLRREALIITP